VCSSICKRGRFPSKTFLNYTGSELPVPVHHRKQSASHFSQDSRIYRSRTNSLSSFAPISAMGSPRVSRELRDSVWSNKDLSLWKYVSQVSKAQYRSLCVEILLPVTCQSVTDYSNSKSFFQNGEIERSRRALFSAISYVQGHALKKTSVFWMKSSSQKFHFVVLFVSLGSRRYQFKELIDRWI